VNDCFSSSTVTGNSYVGGLVGRFGQLGYPATLTGCYSTGAVNGTIGNVGGLVGYAQDSSSISNSYSSSPVSGNASVGGLVGYFTGSRSITNSYSRGSVTGSTNVGGLVGYNSTSTVTRSYWDTQASGQAISAGGTSATTAEMNDVMTFLISGWDIKGAGALGIWNLGNGRNDSYPYLDWQYPDDPANPAVTNPYAPVVSTQVVTQITGNGATFNGTIISVGNPASSQHGFCWNTTGSPSIADSLYEAGAVATAGAYTAQINTLIPNTT
jgi:hypothetical protein